MDPAALDSPEQITRDERTTAMLAHVLTIFAGFVAAGVIYVIKRRESRFVAFHALQAFFWHALFFVVLFVAGIAFFVFMIATARFPPVPPPPAPGHAADPPPLAFFVGVFGVWGLIMLAWLASIGSCIYLAVRASEGKWTRYPLVGSLALRLT
jgi:uncharacterized membrane protein